MSFNRDAPSSSWNGREPPGGASRQKDRLQRLREVLRRPLFEFLEERLAPAVAITFDYSQDTSGFFTQNPAAKTVLNEAAAILGSQLENSLSAINPLSATNVSQGNTWVASFNNPSKPGTIASVNNLVVPANTLIVYVGAAALGNSEDGLASADGFTSSGSQAWNNLVGLRGQAASGYGPWGGSISFDNNTNWSFAGTGGTPATTQVDFLSVALHELGHVLGYGTASSWSAGINSATTPPTFTGAHAEAVNNNTPAPLDAGLANWAEGTTSGGNITAMDPTIVPGVRRLFSSLDWAGLADIGWSVDQLVVTAQPPASFPAANGFGLTVAAEDPNGLVDATYNGSVALALLANPGGATLSGTATAQAVGGVATFAGLSLNRSGAGYTLQATSALLTPATSNAITIVAETATQLVVTAAPPSSVSAGGGFGFTVSAEDPLGNLDTNYAGSVSLAVTTNPGSATLSGTTTEFATGGVASFSNLTLNNPGVGYQVTAIGSGLSPTTTGTFSVTTATATTLVVTTQPAAPVTVGSPGFGLTVSAEDSAGNLDPTFSGLVTVSLNANPGGSTLGGTTTVTAVGGVATFSGLTLTKVGSGYTLQVSTGTLLTPGVTAPFNVSAAAGSQLFVVTQPPFECLQRQPRIRHHRLCRGWQRKRRYDLQRPGDSVARVEPRRRDPGRDADRVGGRRPGELLRADDQQGRQRLCARGHERQPGPGDHDPDHGHSAAGHTTGGDDIAAGERHCRQHVRRGRHGRGRQWKRRPEVLGQRDDQPRGPTREARTWAAR